ncbi:MAG: NUDIX domain-containing protein [Planctomyces sp.]|nr:NUDIX domain-containing protein [Planctomyces sp.]
MRIGIAVVESQGACLVGRRGPEGPLPGYHEFPGGKLLEGEAPEAGAVRECLEESGLEVRAVGRLTECVHEYPHGRLELTFVLCEPVSPGPRPTAGRFDWVEFENLGGLNFPEANAGALAALRDRHPAAPAGGI